MANAYGFRPPPNMQAQPQQVGAAMIGGMPQGRMRGGGSQHMREPPDPDAELRREGGRLMTTAQTTEGDAAVLSAVGEALTRTGSGYQTNVSPSAQFKNRGRAANDLQRLGLSPTEAELMLMTGGF